MPNIKLLSKYTHSAILEAIQASRGGRIFETAVKDPLGRLIEARWLQLEDGTAVIESAEATGLTLLKEAERDPRIATTYGVGELIAAGLERDCERLIVGLGGSGTNDGGALRLVRDREGDPARLRPAQGALHAVRRPAPGQPARAAAVGARACGRASAGSDPARGLIRGRPRMPGR